MKHLSEEEREKIIEDEILRNKIRMQIENDANSQKNKFISFFNSGFGLWLLSSCLLTGITFFYNMIEEKSKSNKATTEAIRTLDIEIGARLSSFSANIDRLNSANDTSASEKSRRFLRAISSVNSNDAVIFEDYKNRPFSSLLYELYFTVPKKDKDEIKRAFTDAIKIDSYGDHVGAMISGGGHPLINNMIKEANDAKNISFNLTRWQKLDFAEND